MLISIGLAPITQYTHLHNKNSNIQGSSTDVVKVIFHYHKELHASGSKFFTLREVPI